MRRGSTKRPQRGSGLVGNATRCNPTAKPGMLAGIVPCAPRHASNSPMPSYSTTARLLLRREAHPRDRLSPHLTLRTSSCMPARPCLGPTSAPCRSCSPPPPAHPPVPPAPPAPLLSVLTHSEVVVSRPADRPLLEHAVHPQGHAHRVPPVQPQPLAGGAGVHSLGRNRGKGNFV